MTQTKQKTPAAGSASFAFARARAHRMKVPVRRAVTPETYRPATVEKRIVPEWEWIPENFIDPTTVNVAGTDFSSARLLHLQDFQTRILKKVFTPDGHGRFSVYGDRSARFE